MLAYFKKRIITQNKGVVMRGGRYTARMYVDNCSKQIGTYDTPGEASLAYERAKLSIAPPKNPPASTDSNPTTETPSEARPTTDAKAGVSYNKRKHRSYVGVVINKRQKFVAQIRTNNEQKKLGTYDTPEEAARAFDRAVIERKLPSSLLNYPVTEGGNKTAQIATSSVKAQKNKFVKHQQVVAHGNLVKNSSDKTDEDLEAIQYKGIKLYEGNDEQKIESFEAWYEYSVTHGTDDECKAQGKPVDRCRPALKAMQKLYWLFCEKHKLPRLQQRSKPMSFKDKLEEKGHDASTKKGKTGAGQRKVDDGTKTRCDGDQYVSNVLKIKGYTFGYTKKASPNAATGKTPSTSNIINV